MKSAKLDVREGGRYAIVFSTLDGVEHQVSRVYREVVPNHKLVFCELGAPCRSASRR